MKFTMKKYVLNLKDIYNNQYTAMRQIISDRDSNLSRNAVEYFKNSARLSWLDEKKRDNIIIDFSQIYPNKYARLLRDDTVDRMQKFFREIEDEAKNLTNTPIEEIDNGLFLAFYFGVVWHMTTILLVRPVLVMKMRDAWQDFMTYEFFINKSELDKYKLLHDLYGVKFDKIYNSDIDDRDLKVIETGVLRILKNINIDMN